jgi:hypothetical protein
LGYALSIGQRLIQLSGPGLPDNPWTNLKFARQYQTHINLIPSENPSSIFGGNAVVYLKSKSLVLSLALLAIFSFALSSSAQTTLGGITGTVVDPSGSAIPGVEVKATSDDTKLVRTAKSNSSGSYQLNDLPIGKYTLTFTLAGFSTEKIPNIVVQADRTMTLPAKLALGAITDSVTVEENPLLNAVDTTNGYVLDKAQIEAIPLPTGSFTGVAILSPGVNAELRPRQRSHLGQRPARHQQQLLAQRRRRQQPLQRQIHQPGQLRPRHQQHRNHGQRCSRRYRLCGLHLSLHRQRYSDSRS